MIGREDLVPLGLPDPKRKRRGFAAAIGEKFREAMRTLTRRLEGPRPNRRSGRAGDSVSAFRRAARRMLRPVLTLPKITSGVTFVMETLAWLHIWECSHATHQDATEQNLRTADDNCLSPRP